MSSLFGYNFTKTNQGFYMNDNTFAKFLLVAIIIFFIVQKAYYFAVAAILFIAFYKIVVVNKKYKNMKVFIERFF